MAGVSLHYNQRPEAERPDALQPKVVFPPGRAQTNDREASYCQGVTNQRQREGRWREGVTNQRQRGQVSSPALTKGGFSSGTACTNQRQRCQMSSPALTKVGFSSGTLRAQTKGREAHLGVTNQRWVAH